MFKGGIANKLGNRYEAKWLICQLLDVIGEKAEWVRYEGITSEFKGFEFAVRKSGITEWHQTKINAPNGNWTIGALKREKVLSAFKKRLEDTSDDFCVFISQDPVKDIYSLIQKCKIANNLGEFVEGLSIKENQSFESLVNTWKVDYETAYHWLKRCKFELYKDSAIDTLISAKSELYFTDDSATVSSILRNYLEENFNKQLTADSVRRFIREKRLLQIKDLYLDPTISESICQANEKYLNTYNPFGFGDIIISRQQTKEIVDLIKNPEGPNLILLTGNAGSGKSGVVRGIIKELESLNIKHLAFRADHNLTKSTPKEIGNAITERSESPVTTLKRLHADNLSVLIVDQIDAVSEVSGRNGVLKEAILQIASQANIYGTVRVLLVCRTFDFESDSRLKLLKEKENAKKIELPLLDWKTDVEPILIKKEINAQNFSQKQRQLLCLPLNLAIFVEIAEEGHNFLSRNDLFNKLLEKKERSVRNKDVTWSVIRPLSDLSKWMSDRQVLNAPQAILDDYPGALDILTSEGLIIQSKTYANFFHESFFDYLYARSFIGSNQSIIDLLTSSEQHLFRRTQIRQILETLKQNDFGRYIKYLKDILFSNRIRYHIKVAVSQWLGSMGDPTKEELDIILELDSGEESFQPLIRYALLSSANWFNLLLKRGWIIDVLNSSNENRRKLVFWWISDIAGEKTNEITNLLDDWWGSDSEKGNQLLDWFGMVRRQKPDDSLIALCERVIRSKPNNLFARTGRPNIEFLLANWVEEQSEKGAGILKSLLDVWFLLHPNQHPFENIDIKDFEEHSFKQIAEKSPLAFIYGTIDALNKTVDIINNKNKNGITDYTFKLRTYSGHRFGADEFIGLFRESIQKLAMNTPEVIINLLSKLDPSKHPVMMHIHLETISANGKYFAFHLTKLIKYDNLFEDGLKGDEWNSFANASKTAFPYLSKNDREEVVNKILKHTPEIDLAIKTARDIKEKRENASWPTRSDVIYDLNRSGYEQWCILETIGEEHLTEKGIEFLKMLRRKFPQKNVPKYSEIQSGWIQSPIPQAKTKYMSDKNWLRAITQYNSDRNNRKMQNLLSGGADELARVLEGATKENPKRFVNLISKIPDTAHKTYIGHILRGLTETDEVDDEDLLYVIHNAHDRPGKPYGAEIARLFNKHPHLAKHPSAFEMLIWHLENGKASDEKLFESESIKREIVSIKDLIERGETIYLRGINGERGYAAEALGTVLWKLPEVVEKTWSIIERIIEIEPLISVRCCIISALVPLYNHDRIRSASLLERLISKTEIIDKNSIEKNPDIVLSPLITRRGIYLLPFILSGVPKIGKPLVERLLDSSNTNMHLVGAWLIYGQSFQDEDYLKVADHLIEKGTVYRGLAADVASQTILYDEFRYRAELQLLRFFNDEDAEVRKKAAGVFRNIEPDDFERFFNLGKMFIDSQAFKDDSFGLLHKLGEVTSDVQELVVLAAERIISEFDIDNAAAVGRHDLDLHHLKDLLRNEYNASENDPKLRKRILDVIDKMLEKEIYGIHEILKAHERE